MAEEQGKTARQYGPSVGADNGAERSFSAPWGVFFAALAVRVVLLFLGKLYLTSLDSLDQKHFGAEAGHIARALVTGRGFADPFWWHATGPTAWLAPGYPLVLAAIFKFFGIFTIKSAIVSLLLQAVANAWIVRMVWEIGARCFSQRTGSIAAWLWALSPYAMIYALVMEWETTISTSLFCLAFLITLRLRGIGNAEGEAGYSWPRWAAWGTTWGAIALFNPSLLLFLPCAGIWLLLGKGWQMQRKVAGAVLAGSIFCAMMAPWWVRNERVFHQFIPARGNLGVEICNGNCYGIAGLTGQWEHPNHSRHQMELYTQLGEVAYNKLRMQEFKSYVRQNPKTFAEMIALRIGFYWFSLQRAVGQPAIDRGTVVLFGATSLAGLWGLVLAWRRKLPATALFAWAMFAVPSLYYIVATQERFRHPLEPLLYCLGVFAFQCAEKSWRVSWFSHAEEPELDISQPWGTAEVTCYAGKKAA